MKLIITDEDRQKYEVANTPVADNDPLVLYTEPDRFLALNKPIEIPRVPTIYDLRAEGALSEKAVQAITKLAETFPKTNFDNLTASEAVSIQEHNTQTKNLDRKQIWTTIKPFFNSVFNLNLGDDSSKMTEIARRSDNNPDYVPTYEWLTIICKRILDARKDLFIYNIDLGNKRYNHQDNPIEFLLMLMKVQKEFYPKRSSKLSDTYFTKFNLLMQSHAELMVKLQINGKTGRDFFGSKYDKIKDSLRTLKNISYNSFGEKPLTIKQQQTLINIIDDYRKTLELIFTFNEDDRVLYNTPFQRPGKNSKLAALEVYYLFDDSSTHARSFKLKSMSYGNTTSEIINSVFISGNHGKQLNSIYKNAISIPALTDYIDQYFTFDKKPDREIIRKKHLDKKSPTQKMVLGHFFDSLDKYFS